MESEVKRLNWKEKKSAIKEENQICIIQILYLFFNMQIR